MFKAIVLYFESSTALAVNSSVPGTRFMHMLFLILIKIFNLGIRYSGQGSKVINAFIGFTYSANIYCI